MRRSVLFMVATLAVPLAGCGRNPLGPQVPAGGPQLPPGRAAARTFAPPCATQTPACFEAMTTVTVGGSTITAIVWSQDLPTQGYLNRWHYLVSPEAAPLVLQLDAQGGYTTTIDGGAVLYDGRGGMYMLAVGAWRLDMRPTSNDVAQAFAGWAGAREVRYQPWHVVARADGWAEILIEEPCDGTPFPATCP